MTRFWCSGDINNSDTLILFFFCKFLNAAEFCKGIYVYEEVIKAYASYDGREEML